jgi:hypothetical protein
MLAVAMVERNRISYCDHSDCSLNNGKVASVVADVVAAWIFLSF